MSYINENQPQEIGSFELNGKLYNIYEVPALPDFIDLIQVDEDGDEIERVLEAIISSEKDGVITVGFVKTRYEVQQEEPVEIHEEIHSIVTTKETFLDDVTEAFKKLLNS